MYLVNEENKEHWEHVQLHGSGLLTTYRKYDNLENTLSFVGNFIWT